MASRYFKDRAQAGQLIAGELLPKYRNENCVVVALTEGAVIVGAQIAIQLHANLVLLLSQKISLPGEQDPMAGVTSAGGFSDLFPGRQLEDYEENFTYIEGQRLEKFRDLTLWMGREGTIDKERLQRHVVIAVSDGLNSGFSLDMAADFLKPLNIKKLVIATPVASVEAVERMHLLSDAICCLSVAENYISTDHYYEDNTVPGSHEAYKIIDNISMTWSGAKPPPKASEQQT